MDLSTYITKVPSEAREFLDHYLASKGLDINDPLAADAVVHSIITKSSRKGRFLIGAIIAISSAICGYLAGNGNGMAEAYKAKPMVEITASGSTIDYGTHLGFRIIKVHSVKWVWQHGTDGYIAIQN